MSKESIKFKILVLIEESLPKFVHDLLKQHNITFDTARGPLTINSKLQTNDFNGILWLNNSSFLSLFDDIVKILNIFDLPVYFQNNTDLSPALITKLKCQHKVLAELTDLVYILKDIVSQTDKNEYNQESKMVVNNISNKSNELTMKEELNFRNLLRSKTKQAKFLADTSDLKINTISSSVNPEEKSQLIKSEYGNIKKRSIWTRLFDNKN